jgi:hypothetical protein
MKTAQMTLVALTCFLPLAAQQIWQAQHIPTLTAEQQEILGHLSLVYLDDGQGGQTKTIRVTGVNIQVVNGLGATNGNPVDPQTTDSGLTQTNGLGNLILGYNELGHPSGDDRTGSHNLLVGTKVGASSFGGIAAGLGNRISGPFATVTGGASNHSSGLAASISGGNAGLASGQTASITGGQVNTASALRSTVLGGSFNKAQSQEGVIVGGHNNLVGNPIPGSFANKAVVVGGYDNQSRAQGSLIVGGRYNQTTANYSAILAGANNFCTGDSQGGGSYCSIVGGQSNTTSNITAGTVSGGQNRAATGHHDWVAGSLFQDD